MATSADRNKPLNRPKKSLSEKRRRRKAHEKRLVALGVPAEKIRHLDTKKIRTLLRRPKKTAALAARNLV